MPTVEECRDEDVETWDNIEIDNHVSNNSRSSKPSYNVFIQYCFINLLKMAYVLIVSIYCSGVNIIKVIFILTIWSKVLKVMVMAEIISIHQQFITNNNYINYFLTGAFK